MSKSPRKNITKTEVIIATAVLLVATFVLLLQQGIINMPQTERASTPIEESGSAAIAEESGSVAPVEESEPVSPAEEGEPAIPVEESVPAAIVAEITSPSDVYTISLDVDASFHVDSMPNVVFEVSDGEIAFVESDCPNQVCVNTGFLSRRGHVAACLPNGMLLMIVESEDDGDIDIFIH